MFSLNVPLPGRARARVEALRPVLGGFDTVRDRPTLVVKRFGRRSPEGVAHVESEARAVLAGVGAFDVRLDGFDAFERPPAGPGPVAYLAVESPGLERVHDRLVEAFGAEAGLEGEAYVPHVTLARGGDAGVLDGLTEIDVEPVTWSATELWFWDARRDRRVGRVSLRT